MLDSLTFELTDDGVEVGIFNSSEAPKAYGHNTGFAPYGSTDGDGPKRKFIPNEELGEMFRPSIREEIQSIISEYEED